MGKILDTLQMSILNQKPINVPNKRHFDYTKWYVFFKDALDDKDMNLYLSGCFAEEILASLRKNNNIHSITAEKLLTIKAIIANLSREIKLRCKELTNQHETNVNVGTLQNNMIDVAPYCDTFSLMLKNIKLESNICFLQYKTQLLHYTNHDNFRKLFSDIENEIRVAWLYYSFEQYWNMCIWSEYKINIDSNKKLYKIEPQNNELDKIQSMSSYRRDRILNNEIFQLIQLCKNKKFNIKQIMTVSSLELSDDNFIKHIITTKNNEALNLSFTIYELILNTYFFKAFLNINLVKGYKWSISNLFHVWFFIYSYGVFIFNNIDSYDDLDNFAPLIEIKYLTKILSENLGFSESVISEMIEYLTFNSQKNDDIMSQPLIKVNNEYILVISFAVFVSPYYLIEKWINLSKNSKILDSKGYEFETYVRKSLDSCLRKNEILKDKSFIVLDNFKFKSQNQDGEKEEIDLIIVIGSTLILCELKCILYPTTPIEYFKYYKRINRNDEGVGQVIRKSTFVEENYEEFCKKLKQMGYNAPSKINIKIIKCVLTSTPIYSGLIIDDVYILDVSIIESYLNNEYVYSSVFEKNELKEIFNNYYTSSSEAEDNLKDFLTNPPHFDNLKLYTSLERTPELLINEGIRFTFKHHLTNPDNSKIEINIMNNIDKYKHRTLKIT
ncbi:MAG: hypothetical protein K2P52_09880 [Campylobacterales bacterium]|nr:hypothetical protein [Campylobacterales bacterium]